CLIVGNYRSDEVSAGHPLLGALDEIRRHATSVREISVGPLAAVDVTRMLRDALGLLESEAEALAAEVESKTGGNPFFIWQFLRALQDDGELRFDPFHERAELSGEGPWRWSPEAVSRHRATDNVADLIAARVERAPAHLRGLLELASALGTEFD